MYLVICDGLGYIPAVSTNDAFCRSPTEANVLPYQLLGHQGLVEEQQRDKAKDAAGRVDK